MKANSSASEQSVFREDVAAIAVLTIARPPANAFDPSLVGELETTIQSVATDDAVCAVIIQGGGKLFSAGADINFLSKLATAGEVDALVAHVRRIQDLFSEVARLPFPTIAALHGAAVGGGLELAMACDIRVAEASTRLGLPETEIGLIPAAGGTQRISGLVDPGTAANMVFSGALVTAAEAAPGLVQHVVPDGLAHTSAVTLAKRIANRPRHALLAAKRCLRVASARRPGSGASELANLAGESDGFHAELIAVAELARSQETIERLAAFGDSNG